MLPTSLALIHFPFRDGGALRGRACGRWGCDATPSFTCRLPGNFASSRISLVCQGLMLMMHAIRHPSDIRRSRESLEISLVCIQTAIIILLKLPDSGSEYLVLERICVAQRVPTIILG